MGVTGSRRGHCVTAGRCEVNDVDDDIVAVVRLAAQNTPLES
jgi:hypothetical protein